MPNIPSWIKKTFMTKYRYQGWSNHKEVVQTKTVLVKIGGPRWTRSTKLFLRSKQLCLPKNRVANWSDSKIAMHKAKKCQKEWKSATVIFIKCQKMPSLIFAFFCIFINKCFSNFMPKSVCLKKLHDNFMILCWCSILYGFPLQVLSSEQHFAPNNIFCHMTTWEKKK